MCEPMRVISLGAGVQSSTMALMAAKGEITPMPTAAIFADTQAEPAAVYRWLDWLEGQLPFPVRRVTRGNLANDAVRLHRSKAGKTYTKHAIPAFVQAPDGRVGMAKRQCTSDHKIEVIQRELRRLRAGRHVEQWIGISRDEASRMKPARKPWITNRWPLVEAGVTRAGCLRWMDVMGYPAPPRSACVFCPYHNDAEWLRLKTEAPTEFADAVAFEGRLQEANGQAGFHGRPFLHRSCLPLDQVDLRPEDERTGQGSLFDNECEGMCGV